MLAIFFFLGANNLIAHMALASLFIIYIIRNSFQTFYIVVVPVRLISYVVQAECRANFSLVIKTFLLDIMYNCMKRIMHR